MEVAGESVGTDLCVGPNTFCCGSRSRADTQVRPYAGWKVFRTTQASGAQRSVCGAGAREWAGIGAGITPKEPSTLDNPSVSLRLPAPFTQGSLGDGGCGLPRRFAPRNDSPDHSEEAQRADVGIRPFLRWTGVRAAVRKTRGTARRGRRPLRKGEKAQSTTQASRRAAKRPRPRLRGMGGNRRKDHPKRGAASATAEAAL